MSAADRSPSVAILPWGFLIEDFLDRDGISLEVFSTEFVGSWIFGYADALRHAGVRTVVISVSARVSRRLERRHEPSGALVVTVPAPRVYRFLRRRMSNPYGRSSTEMFGPLAGARQALRPGLAIATQLSPYLATPLRALASEIRGHGCRAILVQEYEFPSFDLCVLLGRFLRVPTFGTFQGGNYQRWKIERLLRPLSVRGSAGLIVASGVEAERVVSRYRVPPRKLARLPNPIDVEEWRREQRTSARAGLEIADTTTVVAWHGRVAVWKKGLDLLLEAWREVERSDTDVCLLLLGSGRDDPQVEALLTDAEATRVTWIKELVHDRTRIREVLSAADIYAFPSRHEGFPVALLEAMACGLAVVAADVHGVREIVGTGDDAAAVVVPPGDVPSLAAALTRLAGDEAYREVLGRRARDRVKARFSLDAVGPELARFLLGRADGTPAQATT